MLDTIISEPAIFQQKEIFFVLFALGICKLAGSCLNQTTSLNVMFLQAETNKRNSMKRDIEEANCCSVRKRVLANSSTRDVLTAIMYFLLNIALSSCLCC